ncbi:MAG: serine/threonine protein kinase [Deltaproteobacteria bacterium]|nr:serine/threonine protein kinase [Deltaproteobacteria bacterium]
MAQIYLARKQGLEGFSKFNVVKRILPHLSENDEFVKMFLDEARIAARLDHPNIVQIFDFGAADDTYYIAMEYIHGEDVRRVWKAAEAAGRTIPVPLVCRVISDASAGLDFAHGYTDPSGLALNIVHRDVSPQNILVTFEGGVKVVDFGIAKAADQATVTRSGVLKGKYSYMSPEQAAGHRVDRRTDIFALGVVMYELLTGERLFKRSNDILTLNAVTECEVAPPSKLVPTIPPDLDAIVLRALAKNPQDRYQEAGQLRLALEDWLTEHRQPGSNAHLSAFMKELFAERLAEERESGPAMMEELRSSAEDAPGPPRSRSNTGSPRTRTAGEATASARPDRASPERASPSQPSLRIRPRARPSADALEPLEPLPPPTAPAPDERAASSGSLKRLSITGEHSLAVTESGASATARDPDHRTRTAVAWAVTAVLCLAALGVGWLLVGGQEPVPVQPAVPPGPVSVRVETEPARARVWVDNVAVVGETPLELPPLSPGPHVLAVKREGFQPWSGALEVPSSGAVQVPRITLLPLDAAAPAEVPDAGSTSGLPVEPRPVRVSVELRTRPEGATLELPGRTPMAAPVAVELEAGSSVRVKASLPGYLDLDRDIRVGSGPVQQEELVLRKRSVAPPPGGGSGGGDGEPRGGTGGGAGGGSNTPTSGTGYLLVVVKDGKWANVDCNGQRLGETPFPTRELAAGSYRCTFTNPNEQDVVRTFDVKPGKTEKVIVQFP